jgi:CheY-like chemotaxis protein
LIVEDHADVRAYLQVLLGERYSVMVAENGKDALDRMTGVDPDLVLSDLRMPELDGIGLLSAVRARDQRRADGLTTPFMLVSARDDSMDRASAYGLGVSDFVTKPFLPKDLLARIEGLLATQSFLRKRRPVYQVSADPVSVPSQSATFLARVARVAGEHLGDPDFGISELATSLGYSRSGLYRKLSEVGEVAPSQLLQRIRLDRAAQMLRDDAGSVSRIARDCGFRSLGHFSRAFKARFGVSPSQFVDAPSTGTQRQIPATPGRAEPASDA